ncbi:glycosyltransferase [Aliivibrio fischeri]|uniref:glycosyltransferase n=1 Tax=Aliivibrio fischeri TaxID=668 RepID=UPI0012D85443|nr:glycosyltransferase [Aliivibrio fischeri]MUK26542.1 glycosyltransferase [Aliivibrio fischeri]MUK33696.1 glycosyltransferase [Aliivibrio fischeri]
MRIAVVVNCLKIGGMERVAVNLADAFYNDGHSIELIYLKNRKKEVNPRNKELPVHLFNLKKAVLSTGIGLIWFFICKLLNVVFKKTFPLFFTYAESYFFKNKLSQLEKKNGQPFDLVIFRGQGTFEHLWNLHDPRYVYVCESVQTKYRYGKLSRLIFSKLFTNRKVVCVSDGAYESFLDLITTHSITPKKHLMISNPNDFQQIELESYTQKQLHHNPYILGLGRLVPNKNFSLLIEAYNYAVNHYNIKQDLLIVGGGKDLDVIQKKIVDLNLTERIYLKGQQSNPFPWYKQAELFVLSSKSEGLGMVLIEALACKTKIVSTDCKGGVRQIMNGNLTPFLAQETPESLGEKIYLALNTEWDESFDSSIKKTLNNFDAKTIINKYIHEFSV